MEIKDSHFREWLELQKLINMKEWKEISLESQIKLKKEYLYWCRNIK